VGKRAELDEVAEEVYACVPAEFTAIRNAKAHEARAAGKVELADALRRLQKPTAAAWLANLLVRALPRKVADLVAFGAALRSAQAALDGEALRRLSEQRGRVVGGLSHDARRLAAERGQNLSDAVIRELELTLEAAIFDPGAAEQLQRGRLTGALTYSGIGLPSLTPSSSTASMTVPTAPGPSRASTAASRHSCPTADRSGGRGDRGTRKGTRTRKGTGGAGLGETTRKLALREAQAEMRDALKAAQRATTAVMVAERAHARKRAAVSIAEAELARRREGARAAQRAVVRARADRDAAERLVRKAEQRVGAGSSGKSSRTTGTGNDACPSDAVTP